MHTKFFCFFLLLLFALGCSAPDRDASGRASPDENPAASHANPHIVIILADDMGYGDLGSYNEFSRIPTPEIDRLAAEGMRFTDAHAPGTLCHHSAQEEPMKLTRLISVLFVMVLVLSLSGCFTIDAPVNATSNPVGSKVGEASGSLILGIGTVDASIREAAANGGISEISTVDLEVQNILNVYHKITTTVTGE